MAFYCFFLTRLCYGMFQSGSQKRGRKTCGWTSHFHLQGSAAYPCVQYRSNMNVTHCTLLFILEGVFARGNKAAADSSPFILARVLVLTLPPPQLTSAHPSPSCWRCAVWSLQDWIKRSTFYTIRLRVRAEITVASYFSSWLIAFNSLSCYIWFTGPCKSTEIDWVNFLNNAFDCLI